MGVPKKRTTPSKRGSRRSHSAKKLADEVNRRLANAKLSVRVKLGSKPIRAEDSKQ